MVNSNTVADTSQVQALRLKLQTLEGLKPFDTMLELAQALLEDAPEEAIDLAKKARAHALSPQDFAKALALEAQALQRFGQVELAIALWEETCTTLELQKNPPALLEALNHLSRLLRQQRLFPEAQSRAEQALTLAEQLGDGTGLALALNTLAASDHAFGHLRQALERLGQARAIWHAESNMLGESDCLRNMGLVYAEMGEYPKSLEYLFESLHLLQQLPHDSERQAITQINLGLVYEDTNQLEQALDCYATAQQLVADNSKLRQIGLTATTNLAQVMWLLGRYNQAQTIFALALGQAKVLGSPDGAIDAHNGLGQLSLRAGDLNNAQTHFQAALVLAQDLGDLKSQAQCLVLLSEVLAQFQEITKALEELELALRISRQIEAKKLECDILKRRSDMLEKIGDAVAALTDARASYALERELFNADSDRRTRNMLTNFELERAQAQTETYRLKSELAQRERDEATRISSAKSLFFSQMSHELRTPLHAILGFAEVLKTA